MLQYEVVTAVQKWPRNLHFRTRSICYLTVPVREGTGHTFARCHWLRVSHKAAFEVFARPQSRLDQGKICFHDHSCGCCGTSGPRWLLAGDSYSVPCGLFIEQRTKGLPASLRVSKPQSLWVLLSEETLILLYSVH